VEQIVGDDDILFEKWITKKRGPVKTQPRLIIITKHQVFSIKRNGLGNKSVRLNYIFADLRNQIQRSGHFYDLTQISSPNPNNVCFESRLLTYCLGYLTIQII
jgi:hypothetical protein